MSETQQDVKKKSHRQPHSGRKAEKKKSRDAHVQELTPKQRNPKAFAINSVISAERQFRRQQDLTTKKQHIPVVDRTPLEPPPIIVAIVGPPKVGKTTLLRCLIKKFTRQPLSVINGPVTVISGKKRRITFIECNNDINCMIDLAKVVDLVLLLIDGSFGFEMEVFEFLNICQVHGMPKVMGVLTHLDMLKNSKTLKNTKKVLKHRFWTEVYQGAKLFYLSGIIHGEYLRNEVERLARFIAVMKFRPLAWQTAHPYILADRMEDLTCPTLLEQNKKCERTVSLYGFVRGIPLNRDNSVHIAGFCDTKIADVSFLPDPCPLPDKLKRRSLVDKEKLIYAPFSGVGGIVYDKDAVYIELGGSHSHRKNISEEKPEQELFSSLASTRETFDSKLENCELQLFTDAKPITGNEFIDSQNNNFETVVAPDGRHRRKVIFKATESDDNEDGDDGIEDNEDSEMEEPEESDIDVDEPMDMSESENIPLSKTDKCEKNLVDDKTALNWKDNLSQKAADAFLIRQNSVANLWKLVYGEKVLENKADQLNADDAEEVGGIFKVISEKKKHMLREKDVMNADDCSIFKVSHIRDWSAEEVRAIIRDYFVTGKWSEAEDASNLLKMDDMSSDDDNDIFGDFEDYETGETHKTEEKEELTKKPKRELTKEELLQKKQKLKEKFNAEYDTKDDGADAKYYDDWKTELSKQAELNRTQLEGLDDDIRVQIEGYRPGMYVRLELHNVPCEFVTNFDPTYPIVIGGLLPGEDNIGYVHARIKKHRWHKKILKTRDPVIMSVGWRRFQTLPIYYKLEDNFRQRMLKYTPEHVACMACFSGPLSKAGTGFLAVQDLSSKQEGFRIIATGTLLEANQTTSITKKLKLIGEPLKIFRKTAFIKNMFTSQLEIAKFEGARIRTVSGIRGQIKRACSKPDGAFRATFEDRIKLSDIVFCRTWCRVDVPEFYNPVTTLLLPQEQRLAWKGMKTTGELKRERNIKGEAQIDSIYKPVHRPKKPLPKLKIPKRLQARLPYKDKPKKLKIGPKDILKKDRPAVIRDAHEYKVSSLLRMLRTNYGEKCGKQRREMKNRIKLHRREMKVREQNRMKKEKERRKQMFIKKTKQEAKEAK